MSVKRRFAIGGCILAALAIASLLGTQKKQPVPEPVKLTSEQLSQYVVPVEITTGDIPSPDQANALVSLIRLNGYTCNRINFFLPYSAISRTATIRCDHYRYYIKDRGGNLEVTID